MFLPEAALRIVASAPSNVDRPLYFDPSDPTITVGLILGGLIPYLMLATLATVTKSLILRLILHKEARPTVRRLVAVAVIEVTYAFVGTASRVSVAIEALSPFPMSLVPLLVLGMLCNLPLLPGRNQPTGAAYTLWKRALLAFGLGLIYWGYLVVIAVSVHLALH